MTTTPDTLELRRKAEAGFKEPGGYASPWVHVLALLDRLDALEGREAWQPIETAPRDGTVFLGCNLDNPSFGSRVMYRRVRHYADDNGQMHTEDLGGWAKVCNVEPDYEEGFDVGPHPIVANAPDALNRSVRYGWRPLPEAPATLADEGRDQ